MSLKRFFTRPGKKRMIHKMKMCFGDLNMIRFQSLIYPFLIIFPLACSLKSQPLPAYSKIDSGSYFYGRAGCGPLGGGGPSGIFFSHFPRMEVKHGPRPETFQIHP
jgi:hypothetical protein